MNRFGDEPMRDAPLRDPCEDIEADVSALIDRELDEAGLRRVIVHLEICPSCRRFLDSIRAQVTLHQRTVVEDAETAADTERVDPFAQPASWPAMDLDVVADTPTEGVEFDLFADVDVDAALEAGEIRPVFEAVGTSALRQSILSDVRERVGEVLYQLGRAYICLARHPATFRIIAREPVRVPEFRVRGKALLDGVTTMERDETTSKRREWVEARELLHKELDHVQKNYDKGRLLLEESLAIRPESNACRIQLGHVLTEQSEFAGALELFEAVLADSRSEYDCDVVTQVPYRIYALESLGNLQLWMNENEAALRSFEAVRASGAMRVHADFSSCLLNIAVASLRLDQHGRAADALEECYREFPERREPLRQQLVLHQAMMRDLRSDGPTWARLVESCPIWFAPAVAATDSVSFHLNSYALRSKRASDRERSTDRRARFPETRDRA
ncbi:MAG: zf-HC2 domain-containing protein [Planctomycetes bacterium]|nr:zf-HC2 domain-containing protein [Planctomycetota bacterium]MCB9916926.1 zf-HC2 domain-containing protein [Planctomycetota bacterium]